MNEKQYVIRNQSSERKHFQREEVGRHQYRHGSTDKVFPTRCLLPLRSRWNIMATENVAHRLIREPVTQVGHGDPRFGHSPTQDFPSPSAPPTAQFPRHLWDDPRTCGTSIHRTCWR